MKTYLSKNELVRAIGSARVTVIKRLKEKGIEPDGIVLNGDKEPIQLYDSEKLPQLKAALSTRRNEINKAIQPEIVINYSSSNNPAIQSNQPETKGAQEPYMIKSEVAALIRKTERTVESWMRQGILPYIKIGKGRRATVLFRRADIEAHLLTNFGV